MTQLSAQYRDDRRDTTMPRAPGAEIDRMHPLIITGLAGLKKTSDLRVRFTVFLIFAAFDLGAAQICRRDVALIMLVSCAAMIFLTARLDIVRLRWLLAEVVGRGPLPYAVPADPHGEDPARDEPVAALKIHVGDLICTLTKHKEMAELAEQQPQQWREQGLARWYSPVLAIGSENESIKLGVLGHDRPWWEDRPEKERYFKRSCPLQPAADSRGKSKHSAEAATALMGVLDFLSESFSQRPRPPNRTCDFHRIRLSGDSVARSCPPLWMPSWQSGQTMRVFRRIFAMRAPHAGCSWPCWPRSESGRSGSAALRVLARDAREGPGPGRAEGSERRASPRPPSIRYQAAPVGAR
jgi:hypothetical protein